MSVVILSHDLYIVQYSYYINAALPDAVQSFTVTPAGNNFSLAWSGSTDPTVTYCIAVGGTRVAWGIVGTEFSLDGSVCDYACECTFSVIAVSNVGEGPASDYTASLGSPG